MLHVSLQNFLKPDSLLKSLARQATCEGICLKQHGSGSSQEEALQNPVKAAE
jgi:hypothetical protein